MKRKDFDSPSVRVGILTAPEIHVTDNADGTFTVRDVVIGKQFHWQQKQDQTFRGTYELIPHDNLVTLVNTLPVELYLESVVSSEMNPEAPLEFLKAHAVIARSWLLAQIKYGLAGHTLFDVCADDHCQRYQGIGRVNGNALRAVRETAGQVLTYDGDICDCRYSKCCGGRMEIFSTCWEEDRPHPYLKANPDPYCAEATPAILRRILNTFDQPTTDFYNWTVEYTADELSSLVRTKTGVDFGVITDLIPLHRGPSGRIDLLKIVGTKVSQEMGPELAIRRALSPSHLYSSAFTVEKHPSFFRLMGRGWGHGVGLCQIGAAVMATQGHGFREILSHYYPGAILQDFYCIR